MMDGKNGHDGKISRVTPAGSIYELKGKICIRLEMPGVKKDDLEIRIEDNQLLISGKRSQVETDGKFYVSERTRGEYARVFTLDETIDRERIEASMDNGVLLLTLDRKESEKPKKIEVKAG